MAQKIQTLFIDDLDGGEATETVPFGLDGQALEIDLSAEHAAELRQVVDKYVPYARPIRGASLLRRSRQPQQPRRYQMQHTGATQTAEVREWLLANGYKPSERGRISNALAEAYENRTPATLVKPSSAKMAIPLSLADEPAPSDGYTGDVGTRNPEEPSSVAYLPGAGVEQPTAEAPAKAPKRRQPKTTTTTAGTENGPVS